MSMVPRLVEAALAVVSVPLLAGCGYLAALALAFRRCRPAPPPARWPFLDVIVPAHDEERDIARTVRLLLSVDYPPDLFRVTVVADNCRDATAQRAADAGAHVLVRNDEARRGKGYALAHAFEWALRDGAAEAVVVVDADTDPSPGLLRALAARIASGASAVQADYAVRNPSASWRTTLMTIAFTTFHEMRSAARERLSLSCGLRGNGMCFRTDLLREVPHDAFSVVEDLEYGIRITAAGHRVEYAEEAHVYGEMVSSAAAARSQRRRWEQGRRQIAREHAGRLLRDALRLRDRVRLDVAVDLLVPPLATLFAAACGGLLLSAALYEGSAGARIAVLAFATSLCLLLAHVARGWMLSGTGARGLIALIAVAPAYVAWKGWLALRRDGPQTEWVRTTRESARP